MGRSLGALFALTVVLGACGGADGSASGDRRGGAGVTGSTGSTTSQPSSTTAAPTTTSPEDEALAALGGFTTQEEAEFDLFANPPRPPGPLGRLGGALEPVPDPLPIVRAGPDGAPLRNEAGDYVFVGARFDAAGRLLAADDGQLLDDHAGPVPTDGEGPVLWAVQFDEDGKPRTGEDGEVVLARHEMDPVNRVLVVGDSVILGAGAQLPGAFGGWHTIVDARESRLPGQGPAVIAGRADVGRVVVVMLGHNVGPGEDHRGRIDAIWAAFVARPIVDRVVLVTAAEIGAGQLEWNEALRTFVEERSADGGDPTVHLLDWALFNAAHPEYSDDGLHLTGPGRAELANLLGQFVGPAPDCPVVIGAGPRAGECV